MPTSTRRIGSSSSRGRASGAPAATARPNSQSVRAKNASDAASRMAKTSCVTNAEIPWGAAVWPACVKHCAPWDKRSQWSMAALANILVVSDLHFGEELLPGASEERREAVALGAQAFREFLRYHAVRRIGGRPWRLVI